MDIESNGLVWALESLFYKLSIRDIHINFFCDPIDDLRPGMQKHSETIYFICQEAISNAVTHGRSKNIDVTLRLLNNQLKLYITDDGQGCVEIVKNKGLNSMESRVRALGGEISYGSPDGEGFNIRAVLPLDAQG